MNQNNFDNGKLVDPALSNFTSDWSLSVPDWDKLTGNKRERYMHEPMLWTTKKGAELIFEFTGTAVGAFNLAGPDAGIIEVSIDGGPSVKYDLYHLKFSKNLHYPQTTLFANDLEQGKHTLRIKMLKEKSGNGNAMRLTHFVVNP